MNILVTVCARGGSKGIPGKNIKMVGNRPLIDYTIKTAKEFAAKHGYELELSTDSEKIIEVAAQCGLSSDYRRPDYLADDICGKPDAIRDLVFFAEKKYGKKYDFIIDLDVTSPIRTIEDIEKCLAAMQANPDAKTILSVSPARRNPYFNMLQQEPGGYYGVVIDGKFTARQEAPKVYDVNGSVYVYRRDVMEDPHPRAVTDKTLVYVMDHVCFDLDEPEDYDYLVYLIETGKIKLP